MLNKIKEVLEDVNAKDVIIYDFELKSPLFDYFIIATVNQRQANAVAVKLKSVENLTIKSVEGRNSDWTLIDTGDIIIHLFDDENRKYYNFESRLLDIKRI